MPTSIDFVFLAVLTVGFPCVSHWLQWPRWRKRIETGGSGARVAVYRDILV
jgi:hypothetical protein